MAAAPKRIPPRRNVVPDAVDFRDRLYLPSVIKAPPPRLDSFDGLESRLGERLPVLQQGETNACTGFALANVVNYLRRMSGLEPDSEVSAQMLYSMARRYDEFPGATRDTGSSLRGALRGWFRHGASAAACWPHEQVKMPKPRPDDPHLDWWFDAAKRPLGAFYRVQANSIADMHVALAEAGVLYASAVCHDGWLAGFEDGVAGADRLWEIPIEKARPDESGHAFVIYGYDRDGFFVLNSWGAEWGTGGCARLRYEDWLANQMDCWVVQLGVVTEEHMAVAEAGGLRYTKGKVTLANDEILRDREITPYIVNMENDGTLSGSGRFRTNRDDLRSLIGDLLPKARTEWGLADDQQVDVAIYAHGGLVDEDGAAKCAAEWIPLLYQAKVFPIFFMWETGLFKTLRNMATEALRGQPRPTAGVMERLESFWNRRLEKLLAGPGTAVWDEIKENAGLIATNRNGGGKLLYQLNSEIGTLSPKNARLHLIGHSAGAIVHAHVLDQLARAGWRFASVTFLAPAVRIELFEELVLPHVKSGKVERYTQVHLSDEAERKDPTCRPILGYGRSLLYLVSRSFEGGSDQGDDRPILGMQKHFEAQVQSGAPGNLKGLTPADVGASVATHGGFDDDDTVRRFVLDAIHQRAAPAGRAGSKRPRPATRAGSRRARPRRRAIG